MGICLITWVEGASMVWSTNSALVYFRWIDLEILGYFQYRVFSGHSGRTFSYNEKM